MFCHNKPLFHARSEGLGRLAHSVYSNKDDVKCTDEQFRPVTVVIFCCFSINFVSNFMCY